MKEFASTGENRKYEERRKLWRKHKKKEMRFILMMDLCHLKQKLRIGQEVPKIQRPCGSTWRPCEGRLKLERSVY